MSGIWGGEANRLTPDLKSIDAFSAMRSRETREEDALSIYRVLGGPSGRGQPFVYIAIRVLVYSVTKCLIISQQIVFRDKMGHPVPTLGGCNKILQQR